MNHHTRAGMLLLTVVIIAATLSTVITVRAEQNVVTSRVSLRAGGGTIRAELFEPAGGSKRPPILVLHGAGGTIFDGPEMRRVARHLATEGNAAYVVHYFNRTRTVVALDSTMTKHFRAWRETVRDAVMAVQEVQNDKRPIGIYGYSLGGFLALFTASDNPRVGAVVEHAGGVWKGRDDMIRRMPPVLMVHGERDARVPFTDYAIPLRRLLAARGARVETLFFPQEGHTFSPAAMAETRAAAAKFFRRHLRQR